MTFQLSDATRVQENGWGDGEILQTRGTAWVKKSTKKKTTWHERDPHADRHSSKDGKQATGTCVTWEQKPQRPTYYFKV